MQSSKRVSAVALAAILVLSAWIQYTVVTRSTLSVPMVSDAADYFSYAYNLRHHGVYSNALTWAGEPPPGGITPDALRSPGYPLFLLAVPGLDPSDAYLQRVALVQAGLGVGSVLLVFLVGGAFLRPGWSHLAALVTAVNPHLATISTNLLSEGLFLFTLLAATLASLRAVRAPRHRAFVVAGLSWGLCSLVRPTTLFVVPLAALAAFALPGLRAQRHGALLALLAFLLVQLPWLVRNQGSHIDHSQGSLMVATLHHGAYPGFLYQGRPETLGWPFRFDPASEAAERDLPGALADIAGKFRAAPATYLRWYLVGKPGTFLSWGYVQGHDIFVFDTPRSPYLDDPRFVALRAVMLALHWPLMLLGVVAAALAFWRPRWLRLGDAAIPAARVVAAVVLYAIAFHMVAAPFPRYGVPFRPLLYLLAMALASAPFGRRPPTLASEVVSG
jgi:4-amino-4-deoxy-L-arabinose transferase-like glycosyltransferase